MKGRIGIRLNPLYAVCPRLPKLPIRTHHGNPDSRLEQKVSISLQFAAVFAVVVLVFYVIVGFHLLRGEVYRLTGWEYQHPILGYDYEWTFQEASSSAVAVPNEVTLYVNLAAGHVEVTFVGDPTLLVRAHVETRVEPQIGWGVAISADEEHWEVSVTNPGVGEFDCDIVLGSGTRYTIIMDCQGQAVDTEVVVGANAHIGNVTIILNRGNIDFQMTDTASIADSIAIELEASGSIDVDVSLPSGIGGSFDVGYRMFPGQGITVASSGAWEERGWPLDYVTSDFATANTTVTIGVESECGDIAADLA